MPHSTYSGADRAGPNLGRVKSLNDANRAPNGLEKFPDIDVLEHSDFVAAAPTKWPPRRNSNYARGHHRQKSLSEAIRTIRTRKGSVSQNVHEITDALKAPVSARLTVRDALFLCSSFCPQPPFLDPFPPSSCHGVSSALPQIPPEGQLLI